MMSHVSRSLSRNRFLLVAVLAFLAMAAFPGVILAAEEAAPSGEGEGGGGNIIVFMMGALFRGPIGVIVAILLICCSISMVALCVLLALDLKMASAIPPGFVDEFTDTVNKRKFKEAFEMARNDPSFLGKVLTAGMSRLQYGLEDAREAAMNQLESIKSDKEQKNNYNAVIATLGPLLGLVGTVFGMIMSFKVLASATQINPAKLADGISHALTATLFGVSVSCPAIFFNAFYRNRITKITMEVGHIADDLLTQMYHNSKKPAPPAGAAPAAPPAAPAGR
jgi:biopolymer transport protein ExbB